MLKLENFIIVHNNILKRLNNIFVHEFFKNQRKFFILINLIKNYKRNSQNHVLDLLYKKFTNEKRIMNLFEINAKKHYILQMKRLNNVEYTTKKTKNLNNFSLLRRENENLLLNIAFNIQFLWERFRQKIRKKNETINHELKLIESWFLWFSKYVTSDVFKFQHFEKYFINKWKNNFNDSRIQYVNTLNWYKKFDQKSDYIKL